MAIAITALLAVLFGIIDFGRALYTYSFVTSAAREGARWAMVRGSESCAWSSNTLPGCNATQASVQSYVKGLFGGATNPANATVTPTWPSCSGTTNAPGCTVAVNVVYNFQFMLPFMPLTIPISSSSKMVISQ